MITDPIADYLTQLRNALHAGHKVVEVQASGMRKRITEILYKQGYILKYKYEDSGPQGTIKIALKYDPVTKEPVIRSIRRASRPGLRNYKGVQELPRVINGLGIAIVSTSKGVMTDKEARRSNVGGELVCYVE